MGDEITGKTELIELTAPMMTHEDVTKNTYETKHHKGFYIHLIIGDIGKG